jgi:hypothetical protein
VRDARFALNIAGIWPDPADNEANIAWVRGYSEAIHRYSGHQGGHTNFMAEDDQGRARDNYGANHARLTQLKRVWDPDNVFDLNHNLRPAG